MEGKREGKKGERVNVFQAGRGRARGSEERRQSESVKERQGD